MKKEINILLSSAGRRGYLVDYFKKALDGNGKVYASNSDSNSVACQRADEYTITPLIYSEEYIPFLLEYCKEKSISAIIPLFDIDLPILAKNRELFENIGTKIIVSNVDFINVCNDKWKTYSFLKENNLDTFYTSIDLDKCINDIENQVVNYPLIIKPRWGMGSIGIYIAENEDELRVFYAKVKKEIEKTYLKYEAVQDREHSVIIQELIKGQEYGMDVINDLSQNYCATIVRKKIGMRSGETDCAEMVDNPKLIHLGEKLSKITGHIGNLDVDVFEYNGKYYVLEMNARFGGGYPFSHMAGADLPKAIVCWLNGETVNNSIFDVRKGITIQKEITLLELNVSK